MGEAHPRNMEDGWIPREVWQAPVDCLLSGINTAEPLMFDGNHMDGGRMFQRHRFHPPPMHITNSSSHLVEIPGAININLSIPTHSMVESNGQVQIDPGNGTPVITDAGQGGQHSLPLDDHNVLEDTDEASDEEDEDEVDEDEMSVNVNMTHPHIMNEESIVQCQQVPVQVQRNIHQQQSAMMNMSDPHCHPKQLNNHGLLRQMNGHDHSLHPHSHVNTIIPIFPEPIEFGGNESQQAHMQNENSDPNSGFSVHGKMYLEGRIVLHLTSTKDSAKQWTEPNSNIDGVSFPSCEEERHKSHLRGCAVCRLNTPLTHSQDNHRRVAHRHTVKGVFFTFEDCTIVELYPEQYNCGIGAHDMKHPEHPDKSNNQNPQMPISYLSNVHQQHHPQHTVNKRIIQPLEIENLACAQQTIVPTQPQQQQPHHSDKDAEDDSWLDEFESAPEGDDELKDNDSTEEDSNPVPDELNSSCCANIRNHHHQNHEDRNRDDDDNEDVDNGDEEFDDKLKYSNNGGPDSSEIINNSSQLQLTSRNFQNITVMDASGTTELDLPSSERNLPQPKPIDHDPGSGTLSTVLSVDSEESCPSTTLRPLIKMRNDLKSKMKIPPVQIESGKYRCPVSSCAKPFPLKKNLKQHLEGEHASGNPYRCTQCSVQFTDEKHFKVHICSKRRRMHLKRPGSKSFKPSKVMKSNRIQKILSTKVSRKHNDDQSRSPSSENFECFLKLDNAQKTMQHRDKIESDKVDEEQDLSSDPEHESETFDDNSQDDESKEELLDSKSSRLPGNFRKKNRVSKPFKCEICCKAFTMERRLENHKHSHGVEKTSQCEKCGKRFARKDKLMRHMFVHNEEKMFACDICQKKFSRRDKLTDHLKSHGGADEIHNCPMCQKQFLRPDILKQHVKLHGMRNKHQCPECLRFVTGQDRLQKHMARHEEAKALGQTLLCPLCTKYFIQRQSLKAHIKKFHPDADFDVDISTTATTSSQGQLNPVVLEDGLEMELDDSLAQGNVSCENNSQLNSIEKSKSFNCVECGEEFAKKSTLKKHLRRHCQPDGELEPCCSSPTIANILPVQDERLNEDSDEIEETQNDIDEPRSQDNNLAIMEHSSPAHMLMSFASQMTGSCSVSSSSSSSPPMATMVEPTPAHTILPIQHPLNSTISHFALNSHHHHHLQHITSNNNVLPVHIPLSLAAAAAVVSSAPSMVSSSQENLLNLGTSQGAHLSGHSLHPHHHHLLQHSQTHSTNPQGLLHPQGHIHTHHLGQHMSSSMQHHVSMATQQSMCGSSYVIYPPYPYQ